MLVLKKGKNMGRVLETTQAKGISARPTVYSGGDDSDVPHYHETSYLTFILQGGALAKRKRDEVDCFPGTLTFYYPGQPHQCLHQADFTKSIKFLKLWLEVREAPFKCYWFMRRCNILSQALIVSP